MKTCLLLSAVPLLLNICLVYAKNSDIIVTATRTAQTADSSLASVTIISRSDIERQQARSVQELLRGIPGVSISNNGGAGKTSSVFVRGTESDHTLVLIDGVKVGSATLGTTSFQHLPVDQIERIEIVRGPRSSLYGSGAIGGVIHIFTRKGRGALKPFLSVGGGSYRTANISVGVSGGNKRGWFNLNASGINTEGFNACNGKPSPGGAGCFTIEPDRDGYRNLSGAVRAGYRFKSGFEVDGYVLRTTGDSEFDGSFVNQAKSAQQITGAKFRFPPINDWRTSVAIGRSLDKSNNLKDGISQSRFETERDTFSFQNDITIGVSHLFTFGVDYQDDRIDSTTAYAVTARNNKGLFAQYRGRSGSHAIQVSLRGDDNEQFGQKVTGSASWGYSLNKALRVTAAYATAYKAPTFNELFFPNFGDANLQPESSRSIEFGLVGKAKWGRWSLNVYETRVDDLIAYDSNVGAAANINQAHISGLEAVLSTRIKSWDLRTNLTLMNPENRSNSNAGKLLPRRAKQSFRLSLDRKFARYRFGATLIGQGKRYDDLANNRQLDAYANVDLRMEYVISKSWRIQSRIKNLLDKDYETASFFNQAARSFYLTLRYSPQ